MRPLVHLIEEYALPNHKRATVARFADRHFVLVGRCDQSLGDATVSGPYTLVEAVATAMAMQTLSYERGVEL